MCTTIVSNDYKFNNYFGKHKLFLKIFGVAFSDNQSFFYKVYSFLIIFFLDFTYAILDFAELFKHDLSVVSDTVVYQLAVLVALAKILLLIRYRTKFLHMLNKLEQKPFRPNTERGGDVEEKLLEECLWITNLQTLIYWTLTSLSIIGAVSYTMIRRVKDSNYQQLTYGPFTVLNTTYSPNFEITCLYQGISLFHAGMLFCTTDLFLAGILAHISYQFKILQNNLRRLVEIGYNKMIKDINRTINSNSAQCSNNTADRKEMDFAHIPWKYLKKALDEAVDYHTAITDFANEIEEIFHGLLLFVLLGTLLMTGLLILRSSQMSINDGRLISSLGEACVTCFQVLTVSYWGEEMATQSEKVGMAIYESDFVGTDVKFQKCIVLIIRKSLNSTKVTAGKFAPVCLATFLWIMQSAYSAFIVLRNAQAENM